MNGFFGAIRFLTIFPLPASLGCAEEDLKKSLRFFPVVGLLLGGVGAVAARLLWGCLPPPVAAVLLVALMAGFSGAFHLDGLADCADGFFSARPRERILEIMRDSHTGAMGVVAVVLLLALKIAVFSVMEPWQAVQAAFLAPVAGRCLMVCVMALLPYVRKEDGVASAFYVRGQARGPALWAGGVAYAAFWYAGGEAGVAAALAAAVVVCAFAGYCRYKIGGATGDTLGAACELAEAAAGLALLLTAAPHIL